jgi:hypothetical protein
LITLAKQETSLISTGLLHQKKSTTALFNRKTPDISVTFEPSV